MIPHGDEAMLEGYESGLAKKRAILYVTIDAVATLILIGVFFWKKEFFHPANAAMGIAGGILPDLLVGIFEISRPTSRRWLGRQLARFQRFHVRNHHFLIGRLPQERDIPLRYGLMIQLLALIALMKVIF